MNTPIKREVIIINSVEDGFIDLFTHEKYIDQLTKFGDLLEQRTPYGDHYHLYVNPLYDFEEVLTWCKTKG